MENEIFKSMQQAIDEAKRRGDIIYLYQHKRRKGFFISTKYWDDWLFKTWPGGRKELSMRGKELVQETHCLCGREWSEMGYCYYCEKFKPTKVA